MVSGGGVFVSWKHDQFVHISSTINREEYCALIVTVCYGFHLHLLNTLQVGRLYLLLYANIAQVPGLRVV